MSRTIEEFKKGLIDIVVQMETDLDAFDDSSLDVYNESHSIEDYRLFVERMRENITDLANWSANKIIKK